MIFRKTKLKGAYIVEIERMEDERGFFARSFCANEFSKRDLKTCIVQCNVSRNNKMGTLRGLHYQIAPYAEAKLVRCTMGAIYDVILDLRPESLTFKQWMAVELTAENGWALYIPEGVAHGFQALEDNTEVFYQMAEFYHSECARGVRWNDPTFGIKWPLSVDVIAEKDNAYPLWEK